MGKATILNVYKQKIVHKNIKNKLKKQLTFSVTCFCMIIASVTYCKLFMSDDILVSAGKVFNPITQLYNEERDGVFVNGSNYYIASKDLIFSLPVRSGDIQIVNGEILFKIEESIMIYAPEGGIITECGESNSNTKYIKIMHNENVCSYIENIDIIGCSVGDVVKKGREIATGKVNSVIKMSLYNNNEKVINLKVDKNIIEWS